MADSIVFSVKQENDDEVLFVFIFMYLSTTLFIVFVAGIIHTIMRTVVIRRSRLTPMKPEVGKASYETVSDL